MEPALGKHLVQADFAGTCHQRCSNYITHDTYSQSHI